MRNLCYYDTNMRSYDISYMHEINQNIPLPKHPLLQRFRNRGF